MSYVYLIASDSAVKIGVSNSPERRLASLQTSHYEKLDLIYTLLCIDENAAYLIESRLHDRYREYQLQGEWFRIDPGVIIKDIEFAISLGRFALEAQLHKVKTLEFQEAATETKDESDMYSVAETYTLLIKLMSFFIVFMCASALLFNISMGYGVSAFEIGFYGSSSFIAIFKGIRV